MLMLSPCVCVCVCEIVSSAAQSFMAHALVNLERNRAPANQNAVQALRIVFFTTWLFWYKHSPACQKVNLPTFSAWRVLTLDPAHRCDISPVTGAVRALVFHLSQCMYSLPSSLPLRSVLLIIITTTGLQREVDLGCLAAPFVKPRGPHGNWAPDKSLKAYYSTRRPRWVLKSHRLWLLQTSICVCICVCLCVCLCVCAG